MDEVHPIREKKEELELFRKEILLGLYSLYINLISKIDNYWFYRERKRELWISTFLTFFHRKLSTISPSKTVAKDLVPVPSSI